MPTALVRTCCKLAANLLTPVKVGGARSDATEAADVDEVAIDSRTIEPEPCGSGSSHQTKRTFQNSAFKTKLSKVQGPPAEPNSPDQAPRAKPVEEPVPSSGSPPPRQCRRL